MLLRLAPAGVLLLLPLLAPAAAQLQGEPELAVSVAMPDTLVAPNAALAGAVEVSVRCDILLANAGQGSAVEVELGLDVPAGLAVSVPANMVVGDAACRSDPLGRASSMATLAVQVGHSVAAFVAQQVTVQAAIANSALPAGSGASTSFNVTADYVPRYGVMAEQKVARCADCTFTLEVANLGNAATTFTFTVQQAPGDAKVTLPLPLVVERGAVGQAKVQVEHEGSHTAVALQVVGAAVADPAKVGVPVVVNVLASEPGLLRQTPAGSVGWAALALVGLAITRRRP